MKAAERAAIPAPRPAALHAPQRATRPCVSAWPFANVARTPLFRPPSPRLRCSIKRRRQLRMTMVLEHVRDLLGRHPSERQRRQRVLLEKIGRVGLRARCRRPGAKALVRRPRRPSCRIGRPSCRTGRRASPALAAAAARDLALATHLARDLTLAAPASDLA